MRCSIILNNNNKYVSYYYVTYSYVNYIICINLLNMNK